MTTPPLRYLAAADVITCLPPLHQQIRLAERAMIGLATGADTVTGCDSACLMTIADALKRRGSGIRVAHLVQLLAEGI